MKLSMTEKIWIVLRRIDMTVAELAEKTGQTRQNLANKMKRDNFTINELERLADAMGAEFDGVFTLPDGSKI